MDSGYPPGGLPSQPLPVKKPVIAPKPTAAPAMARPTAAPPLTIGAPAQPTAQPVIKPGGDIGSRTNPLINGQPVPGLTAVNRPPLTETVGTLGGISGGVPVSGGPVGSAPFAPKPAPSLEDRLTGAVGAGDPRLTNTQGLVNNAAQQLGTGPDRTAIAKQAFTDYLSQSGDQFNKDVRSITQRNAAAGRLGSGMYGSDLVDTATAANRDRNYAANQLAQDVASGTISDQFGRLGALSGLEGQQFGQGQTALQNLLGYGQTQFGNQIATQQQQQSLDDQQFRQLLALLGLQG